MKQFKYEISEKYICVTDCPYSLSGVSGIKTIGSVECGLCEYRSFHDFSKKIIHCNKDENKDNMISITKDDFNKLTLLRHLVKKYFENMKNGKPTGDIAIDIQKTLKDL